MQQLLRGRFCGTKNAMQSPVKTVGKNPKISSRNSSASLLANSRVADVAASRIGATSTGIALLGSIIDTAGVAECIAGRRADVGEAGATMNADVEEQRANAAASIGISSSIQCARRGSSKVHPWGTCGRT